MATDLRVVRRPLEREELRLELKEFESRYGVESRDRRLAFTTDGVFRETAEWRRWDAAYTVWKRFFAEP